jgi:hypothetical protein
MQRKKSLVRRGQQPVVYHRVTVPIPSKPWSTVEKVGIGALGVGAFCLLLGAIGRAT